MALTEDAVGDIAEERETGDQNDHQPQLLRVPRAQRSVMPVRQERQDRAGNYSVARERLYVLLVELVDEAVQLGAKGEEGDRDRRRSDRQPRLAVACEKTDGNGHQRGYCTGCVMLVPELARISDDDQGDGTGSDGRCSDRIAARADQS